MNYAHVGYTFFKLVITYILSTGVTNVTGSLYIYKFKAVTNNCM